MPRYAVSIPAKVWYIVEADSADAAEISATEMLEDGYEPHNIDEAEYAWVFVREVSK